MNSIQFLPGLKEIKPFVFYATNADFPRETYEGFVPAVSLETYRFPEMEDVTDRILQVAAAVYDGQLPIKSQEPETATELQELVESDDFPTMMATEDCILNEIAKSILTLPVYLVEQLAEGKTWAMNLVDSNYAAWASQNAYVLGGEYLRVTLGEIDITEEGLGIQSGNPLNHLKATHSDEVDANFDPLWDIDMLIDNGRPVLAQEDLTEIVQKYHPVTSLPLQVKVLKNSIPYPTEQIAHLIPSIYSLASSIDETKDTSSTEQLLIIRRFLHGCNLADTEEANIFEQLGPEGFDGFPEDEIEPAEEEPPKATILSIVKD